MPITIHLPKRLLEAVDRRAGRLGVSRSRLVVNLLDRELARETQWSSGFLERLSDVAPDEVAAIDELLREGWW
jgi:metal-responsive CopG/Arc/MetJ family transcriptional regulator